MPDMTDTNTITRRENARETTGRFGEQEHTGPEVALALDSVSFDDLDARQADVERASADRARWAKLLRNTEQAANGYAARRGQWNDRDDIIGDTIVDIIGQQKRGTNNLSDDAFVQHATRSVSQRYLDPNVHHTALTARKKYVAWVDEFMQDNGRMPTDAESKAKADEIRLSAEPGRRPSEGFERKMLFKELDAPVGTDGATTHGDLLAARDDASTYALDTSEAAKTLDSLEAENSLSKADVRKNIWNIIAEDAPKVAALSLADDRGHRAAVTDFGGPAAVARAWQNGDTAEDHPANDGLFAPFGELDEHGKEQVTGILVRNSDHAERVWDAAMTAAVDVQKLRALKRREARQAAHQAA
jgi:hypothetical protein